MRPKLEDILQKMDYNIYKLSESNNFLLIKSIISLADILHLSILSNSSFNLEQTFFFANIIYAEFNLQMQQNSD